MTAFLVTVAVLFLAGALGNLADLARSVPLTPCSTRTKAIGLFINGTLGAWAAYLLLQGVTP